MISNLRIQMVRSRIDGLKELADVSQTLDDPHAVLKALQSIAQETGEIMADLTQSMCDDAVAFMREPFHASIEIV